MQKKTKSDTKKNKYKKIKTLSNDKEINQENLKLTIKINNRDINLFLIDSLIQDIKKKKEFSSLDDPLVFNEVIKSIKKSSKRTKIFSEALLEKIKKSKEYKQIIKDVRAILRRLYGMFQVEDIKKRKEHLLSIESELSKKRSLKKNLIEYHDAILSTHSSTEERLNIYPEIYKKIFKITKKPKSILDVGCGLNPCSLPYMNLKNIRYSAYDISLRDLEFLKDYFSIVKDYYNLKYSVDVINLLRAKKENVFKGIKKHDVAFLFKVLEVVEMSKSHKISENIIRDIPAKYVVASFPTKTLTKKLMNYIRRGWMHMMLERLGYKYHIIEDKNEIFFIVEK
ncbi:MAG: hypothetical protein ACLFPQ_00540 [Candidatus Woesearchaeota archaeon]